MSPPRARCGFAALLVMLSSPCVCADPVPVIVTYELKKQRQATRAAARDPKAFWIRQVAARIESRKPDLKTQLTQVAIVQITFVVGRDGHLASKAVAKSSGVALADKTAIAMLDRAQPFPPMPEGLQEREMTFTMPVRFR